MKRDADAAALRAWAWAAGVVAVMALGLLACKVVNEHCMTREYQRQSAALERIAWALGGDAARAR